MQEVIYRNGTLAIEIEDANPVAITRDRGRYVSAPVPSRNYEAEKRILEDIEEALASGTEITPIGDLTL